MKMLVHNSAECGSAYRESPDRKRATLDRLEHQTYDSNLRETHRLGDDVRDL